MSGKVKNRVLGPGPGGTRALGSFSPGQGGRGFRGLAVTLLLMLLPTEPPMDGYATQTAPGPGGCRATTTRWAGEPAELRPPLEGAGGRAKGRGEDRTLAAPGLLGSEAGVSTASAGRPATETRTWGAASRGWSAASRRRQQDRGPPRARRGVGGQGREDGQSPGRAERGARAGTRGPRGSSASGGAGGGHRRGGRRGRRRGLEDFGKERPKVQHRDLHVLALETPSWLWPEPQVHAEPGCRAPSTAARRARDEAALGRGGARRGPWSPL